MVEGVIAVDREGKLIVVNPAMTKIFGIEKETVLGRHHLEVFRQTEIGAFCLTCLQKGSP